MRRQESLPCGSTGHFERYYTMPPTNGSIRLAFGTNLRLIGRKRLKPCMFFFIISAINRKSYPKVWTGIRKK